MTQDKLTVCDECGEELQLKEGRAFKTIDIPYFIISQLEFQRPGLASLLERKSGKLVLHSDCEHEVEEFLEPAMDKTNRKNAEEVIECPSCGFSIWAKKDGCERCGYSFDDETLVKS